MEETNHCVNAVGSQTSAASTVASKQIKYMNRKIFRQLQRIQIVVFVTFLIIIFNHKCDLVTNLLCRVLPDAVYVDALIELNY